MDALTTVLMCFIVIIALAIYWTVWKIRADVNQHFGKMTNELSEVRQSLQKK